MLRSIHSILILAMMVLLIVVSAIGGSVWWYVKTEGMLNQQLIAQNQLNENLIEWASVSAEEIYSPTPRTKRLSDTIYNDIINQLLESELILLTADERRLSVERLHSAKVLLENLDELSKRFSADQDRLWGVRKLTLLRSGETIGGVRGVVQSHLQPAQEQFESLHGLVRTGVFASLGTLILTIVCLAIIVKRQVLRPLRSLQKAIIEIGKGDMSVRAPDFKTTELAELSEQFNRMATKLSYTLHHLKMANEDLEAFAYSVSHDLRAPLRAMAGFSKAIEEDYGDRIDGQGKDYLSKIQAAAVKMGALIEDILRLSRVGRARLSLQRRIDLAPICRSVYDELRAQKEYDHVELECDDQMLVDCDPQLIRVALSNLIGNALKFSSKKPNPLVKISVNAEKSARLLNIADNGAGFDQQYIDQLFLPFKRLHTSTEFPGSGIGLTIVKQIIDKHRGEIWAESVAGEGTTIHLRLPDERRDDGREIRIE